MTKDTLVLDNVVLSGFHTAGWFDSIEFWHPNYELIVPQCIWEDEFTPERDITQPPDWLSVKTCDIDFEVERPGSLSRYDWMCVAVAKKEGAYIVTRDKTLKKTAEELGIEVIWDGRFLLDTFQQCGISQEKYDEGVDKFLHDAWLSNAVAKEISEAEKSKTLD